MKNIRKQLVIGTLSFTLFSPVWATTPKPLTSEEYDQMETVCDNFHAVNKAVYKQGFYLGIGGSYTDFNATLKHNDYIYGNFQNVTELLSLGEEALLGYGQKFGGSYYLGGEVTYNHTPGKGGSTIVENGDWLEYLSKPHTIGGFVKAGYFIIPRNLVYIIVGPSYAQFNYQIYAPNAAATSKFSDWKFGITGGIGAEVWITKNFTFDMHYLYTKYTTLNSSYFTTATIRDTLKIEPSFNRIVVSLNYHFD